MRDLSGIAGNGDDAADGRIEHPLYGRPVTVDELRRAQAEVKGTWVPIRPPVGPWHSPLEIREWIRRLETRHAEALGDHVATEGVEAALAQARGWLAYAEKRWGAGRIARE